MSLPTISIYLVRQTQDQLNLIFIGNYNSTEAVAAVGLAILAKLFSFDAIIEGMNTALDTFVSQAYGRKDYRQCGIFLHRSLVVIALFCLPIVLFYYHFGAFMTFCGYEAPVAEQACLYLLMLSPSLVFLAVKDALDVFLVNM